MTEQMSRQPPVESAEWCSGGHVDVEVSVQAPMFPDPGHRCNMVSEPDSLLPARLLHTSLKCECSPRKSSPVAVPHFEESGSYRLTRPVC